MFQFYVPPTVYPLAPNQYQSFNCCPLHFVWLFFSRLFTENKKKITTHFTVTSTVKWGKGLLLNEEVMHVPMRLVLAITLFCRLATFSATWHSVNNDDILCYLSVV
jgi:hypothetical protein